MAGWGGNDERAIALQTFFKQGGGGQQARQDARDLTGATARQQRDAVRAVPRERDGRRGACFGGAIDQWMPREACVERCLLEERGLKGQDAEQQIEYAREFRDAPATPGPDLRTDVVNRFDTAVVREAGEAQVHTGIVYREHDVGLPDADLALHVSDHAQQERQVAQHGGDADDRDAVGVIKQLGPFGAHGIAAEAAEDDGTVHGSPQSAHQGGGVHVAAHLTGADHDFQRGVHTGLSGAGGRPESRPMIAMFMRSAAAITAGRSSKTKRPA